MPIYGYSCLCGWGGDLYAPIFTRDGQVCPRCAQPLTRQLSAPMGRVTGQGWKDGSGGPDQFTADVTGIPLRDLPSGLRSREPRG